MVAIAAAAAAAADDVNVNVNVNVDDEADSAKIDNNADEVFGVGDLEVEIQCPLWRWW
jgi:hypothetical protein